jgi:hypothetical protein
MRYSKFAAAVLVALAGVAVSTAQTAVAPSSGSASGSARVGLKIPEYLGMNVPQAPARGFTRTASAAAGEETLGVSLLNTSAEGSLTVRRYVSRPASSDSFAPVSNRMSESSADSAAWDATSFRRSGAFSWTGLSDRVRVGGSGAARTASAAGASTPATVVYELWQF